MTAPDGPVSAALQLHVPGDGRAEALDGEDQKSGPAGSGLDIRDDIRPPYPFVADSAATGEAYATRGTVARRKTARPGS
jgi:hypothetical protein